MTLACRIRRRQRRDERRAASTERAPWGERRSGPRGHRGRARRAPARRREGRAPQPPPLAPASCAGFRGGVPGGRRRGATICRSSRMRRYKRRGPELFLSAAIKQSWAAQRGTQGPKARGASRGRHNEPAGRAVRADASIRAAQGCRGAASGASPAGAARFRGGQKRLRGEQRKGALAGPFGGVSARTGCRRRTGRLRLRERAREPPRPRPRTCGRA